MALYRFLFAPILLAVAVATGPGPSGAPPSAPRAPVSAAARAQSAPTVPVALHDAAAARPIRAR